MPLAICKPMRYKFTFLFLVTTILLAALVLQVHLLSLLLKQIFIICGSCLICEQSLVTFIFIFVRMMRDDPLVKDIFLLFETRFGSLLCFLLLTCLEWLISFNYHARHRSTILPLSELSLV